MFVFIKSKLCSLSPKLFSAVVAGITVVGGAVGHYAWDPVYSLLTNKVKVKFDVIDGKIDIDSIKVGKIVWWDLEPRTIDEHQNDADKGVEVFGFPGSYTCVYNKMGWPYYVTYPNAPPNPPPC